MGDGHVIGWDLGGAHLKAARLEPRGRVTMALQLPCPLWQGIPHLDDAIEKARKALDFNGAWHAVTMTGELADIFSSRTVGVRTLVDRFCQAASPTTTWVYAGPRGFIRPAQVEGFEEAIASANWRASAEWLALRLSDGLFVDVGSTTTDLVPLRSGVAARGTSDRERMALEELVYTGVVRTPVMAVSARVPWEGQSIAVASEIFATMADVYRLTAQLPEGVDVMATADGLGKSVQESAVRLARMFGADFEPDQMEQVQQCAAAIASTQLARIEVSARLVLSRVPLPADAPVVGAGIGRFVAAQLARRLNRPFLDFADLVDASDSVATWSAHGAPSVAVGLLLLGQRTSTLVGQATVAGARGAL
ncbi:MAG: hydantoinase/oxoprolinase family protein [Burkholderiaceae bacterium]|jgi:probable H4MPT-linked C1 transfer pathway protein